MNKESPIIGCVARIDCAIKGQDLLVDSINILKKRYINIKCYFAGAADSYHQKDLDKLRKKQKKVKSRRI